MLPHSRSTINVDAWLASATAAPSFEVTIAEVPAKVETCTRPASRYPEMLPSEKLNLTDEFGYSSRRPSLPRLIVALLPAAVVMTLSEKIVAPEIAACPLTVT